MVGGIPLTCAADAEQEWRGRWSYAVRTCRRDRSSCLQRSSMLGRMGALRRPEKPADAHALLPEALMYASRLEALLNALDSLWLWSMTSWEGKDVDGVRCMAEKAFCSPCFCCCCSRLPVGPAAGPYAHQQYNTSSLRSVAQTCH